MQDSHIYEDFEEFEAEIITKQEATKKRKELNEKLNMLSKPLKSHKESIEESMQEIKQTIKDWGIRAIFP